MVLCDTVFDYSFISYGLVVLVWVFKLKTLGIRAYLRQDHRYRIADGGDCNDNLLQNWKFQRSKLFAPHYLISALKNYTIVISFWSHIWVHRGFSITLVWYKVSEKLCTSITWQIKIRYFNCVFGMTNGFLLVFTTTVVVFRHSRYKVWLCTSQLKLKVCLLKEFIH
jgi:hypothetical protein